MQNKNTSIDKKTNTLTVLACSLIIGYVLISFTATAFFQKPFFKAIGKEDLYISSQEAAKILLSELSRVRLAEKEWNKKCDEYNNCRVTVDFANHSIIKMPDCPSNKTPVYFLNAILLPSGERIETIKTNGFWFFDVIDKKTSGLIGMFATLFLGGGIIIVATHKVFSLITWLPDNILKWIGSHATAMGEHQDEGRINTIVMASINRAQSGVGGRPPGLDTTKIKDTSAGKLGAGKDNPHSPGQS